MTIAEKGEKFLSVLQASGNQWVRRGIIAKQLGRTKLQASDVIILELLVERGLVESRRVETYAPSKFRVEYRSVTK